MPYLRENRDPRFDSLSGTLDNDRFRKQYAFLYDEQLPADREQIKSTLQVLISLKLIASNSRHSSWCDSAVLGHEDTLLHTLGPSVCSVMITA